MPKILEPMPEEETLPGLVRWTRDQVAIMLRRGILDRERRYELLAGEIYERGEGEPVQWTRKQVDALYRAGLLDKNCRYELIEGEIYEMSENPPHSGAVILLRNFLEAVFGGLYVRSQTPIDVGDSAPKNAPYPDAAVTKEPATAYFARFPGPEDLLLVAEVSDSSLKMDLGKKARLYARAGIPEYWVLNVNGRQLVVHRRPTAAGYADVTEHPETARVATLAQPDAVVLVADLLPPAA